MGVAPETKMYVFYSYFFLGWCERRVLLYNFYYPYYFYLFLSTNTPILLELFIVLKYR